MGYRHHFFVCTGRRPPFARPSCSLRGSEDLLATLETAIAAAGLGHEVAVTGTSCLGPCEAGATVVVYPDGVWYEKVTREDVSELVSSHARDGRPVERLLGAAAAPSANRSTDPGS